MHPPYKTNALRNTHEDKLHSLVHAFRKAHGWEWPWFDSLPHIFFVFILMICRRRMLAQEGLGGRMTTLTLTYKYRNKRQLLSHNLMTLLRINLVVYKNGLVRDNAIGIRFTKNTK